MPNENEYVDEVAAPAVADAPNLALSPQPAAIIPPESHEEITVIARNPQEMGASQVQLCGWAEHKLTDARTEHRELSENLASARIHKWKTSTLDRAVKRAHDRIVFYEKIHAALVAGYCIIPNIKTDVFAIRTALRSPALNSQESQHGVSWTASELESKSPELGEGRYVADRTTTAHSSWDSPRQSGPSVHMTRTWATSFEDVDFPFALAKPAIMEHTQRAMALGIFDDVGVSPDRAGNHVGRHIKGDPMVIGRILMPKVNYKRACMSFVIAWFVDTRDLP